MATASIVPVFHASNGDLISPNMYSHTDWAVLRHVTENSVVILEGHASEKRVPPSHKKYPLISRQLGPSFKRVQSLPELYMGDATGVIYKNLKALIKDNELRAKAQEKAADLVRHNRIPASWEEFVQMTKDDEFDFEITGKLASKWRPIFHRWRRVTHQRDESMAKAISLNLDKGKDVFLIVGAMHVFEIHKKGGWPIAFYEISDNEHIGKVFKEWFLVYKAIDHIT